MFQHTAEKILIVDDDTLIRDSLNIKLTRQGYLVTAVDSGESALNLLKTESFDVILSDLMMTGMDGIDLLKQAKALYPEIEIIILTGHASLESAIEALRLDAYDYLLKPINNSKLEMVIKRCLEKKQLLQAVKAAEDRIRYLNKFYESLLDHYDEAIFVLDHRMKLVEFNRIVTEWGKDILGCQTEIVEGMEFHRLAPRFWEQGHYKEYQKVIETGRPILFEDEVGEEPNKRSVLIRLLPMSDNSAQDRNVLTVITDVTTLKILEEESLRGKKLEGITQAAITLNHEINNPLGIIMGNTNLLMADIPKNDCAIHDKLNNINEQILRISDITRKLSEITEPFEANYLDDKVMIDVNRSI
jgi:PAS domain S-box-containing protein